MLVTKPPMGYNTWNTFGNDINEELIFEIADEMVKKGYKDAGYEYLVIDDCWSEKERDKNGLLVPDKKKFPHGMKYVADYIHKKGLKFGMYTCSGVKTCANYPGSYQHEFSDAQTFAQWEIDFLKYDFCYFPDNGDCKTAYLTMSNALKNCGRDILFSACQWGYEEPWNWMRSIGAHIFRSTGDIHDNFISFRDIAESQLDKFNSSSYGCFNDLDMLTVGMYGKGNVGFGNICTDEDYKTQFALWCMMGTPLMIGSDIRKMNDFCEKLLLNKELISINQDAECRPPYILSKNNVHIMLKFLENDEYALGIFNLSDDNNQYKSADNLIELGYPVASTVLFSDLGFPVGCGKIFELTDVFTGEKIISDGDSINFTTNPHQCKVYKMKAVKRS